MLLLFQAITSQWHYIFSIACCSFMQVHSSCCDTASCAGEAMLTPIINLYPPVKYTTYPWRTTKEWGTHNKNKIMDWFCRCTCNEKCRSYLLECLAHRTQSTWHLQFELLPQFSVSENQKSIFPKYASMSQRKRNQTKHCGTISWLAVYQNVLQIAFYPSLDNFHLSNSDVSF